MHLHHANAEISPDPWHVMLGVTYPQKVRSIREGACLSIFNWEKVFQRYSDKYGRSFCSGGDIEEAELP